MQDGKTTKIEAIAYIRQSDEREDKEDISEKTQLIKIEQYCALNGFTIVKVFKDIDFSGFRIPYTKRPGMMEALQFIKEHKIKKFVVFNLSRLTRLKKDFGRIQSILNRAEVDICSASEQLDFGSATGRLVAGILVDFNEYYSDNLSDVTNDNKTTNAEKGRWNGGPAPFGLIRTKDGFKRDGEKADYISKAFAMAKEGKGTTRIASWLNTHNVLTETGVPWTPRRIRYVLSNCTYAGMQRWKGKYYPLNNCETIVSWDDFLYIQSTKFGSENVWRGRENRQLLSSVLRCPICGSKMHSRLTGSSKSRRYLCNNLNIYGKMTCAGRRIDAESLNQAVIALVGELAQKRYSKEQVLGEIVDGAEDEVSTIQQLKLERDNLELAKQKVFDDYYLQNKFSEDQFNILMKRYEKRQKEIDEHLNQIPLPISKGYGDYDEVLNEFAAALAYLPEEDKRRSIELIVDKIVPGFPTKVFFKWGEIKEIYPSPSQKYNNRVMFF